MSYLVIFCIIYLLTVDEVIDASKTKGSCKIM